MTDMSHNWFSGTSQSCSPPQKHLSPPPGFSVADYLPGFGQNNRQDKDRSRAGTEEELPDTNCPWFAPCSENPPLPGPESGYPQSCPGLELFPENPPYSTVQNRGKSRNFCPDLLRVQPADFGHGRNRTTGAIQPMRANAVSFS